MRSSRPTWPRRCSTGRGGGGEEGVVIGGAQIAGDAAIVEDDEAADPAQAADFGTEGVVFAAQDERVWSRIRGRKASMATPWS